MMMAKSEIVGYADIADMMKISVPGVMKAARTDPSFPKPITPPSLRSPGWDRQVMLKYIEQRGARTSGRAGRPPAEGTKRYKLPAERNVEIEQRIRAAGTFAEFVALAEISDNALRQRFSGKTTWREAELERFAKRLGTTFEELTGIRR
ncbi:hypothetical protein ACH3VR_21765 [Microbacterium sp. B2969]|uniref:HTH cro/C1-type domain-containing protein n=1 Tax=Microbacterium alkaliflavum TaxID=3248839 RepID=A0ABW7QDT9_9MICO